MRIASSPNRDSTLRQATPRSFKRLRQKPSDAAGTEKDVVATPVGAAATGFGGAALQQADTTSPTSSPSVVWVAMAALLGSLVLGSALLRTAVARTRRQPVRVTSGR